MRLFIFFLLFRFAIMYHQEDYTVKAERAVVVDFNRKYMVDAKIANFMYNRTYRVFNITQVYNIDFKNDLRIEIQGYKFASNEYRLFPITFTVNLCEALKSDEFGLQNLYKCGNYTKCPMKKGRFHVCNWAPDFSQFPPFIPVGSYMAEFKFVYFKEHVVTYQAYATVNPIITWHK